LERYGTQPNEFGLMERLMKRFIEKIKLTEIEILNLENAKKFSDEKQSSSYGILKIIALTNTKDKHHTNTTLLKFKTKIFYI
jgi:pyoverdine/dityrosine biosynthesis protein Dit1